MFNSDLSYAFNLKLISDNELVLTIYNIIHVPVKFSKYEFIFSNPDSGSYNH